MSVENFAVVRFISSLYSMYRYYTRRWRPVLKGFLVMIIWFFIFWVSILFFLYFGINGVFWLSFTIAVIEIANLFGGGHRHPIY